MKKKKRKKIARLNDMDCNHDVQLSLLKERHERAAWSL